MYVRSSSWLDLSGKAWNCPAFLIRANLASGPRAPALLWSPALQCELDEVDGDKGVVPVADAVGKGVCARVLRLRGIHPAVRQREGQVENQVFLRIGFQALQKPARIEFRV